MEQCLNCQKPLVHSEGRRKKKFCNDACRVAHFQKTNSKPKSEPSLFSKVEQLGELVSEIYEANPNDERLIKIGDELSMIIEKSDALIKKITKKDLEEIADMSKVKPKSLNQPTNLNLVRKFHPDFADMPKGLSTVQAAIWKRDEEKRQRDEWEKLKK